jgi:hypothetical protein
MKRRTLIRTLVGVGFGVPVLVEGATLVGLVGNHLGDGNGSATAATPTETDEPTTDEPTDDAVGPGDDLLSAAPVTARVEEAVVHEYETRWEFVCRVGVTNDADSTVDVRLSEVTTEGGRTVGGDAGTGPLAPGETGSMTGRFELSPGERPATLAVLVVSYEDDTATGMTRHDVSLAPVPVQGAPGSGV